MSSEIQPDVVAYQGRGRRRSVFSSGERDEERGAVVNVHMIAFLADHGLRVHANIYQNFCISGEGPHAVKTDDWRKE